MAAVQLSPAPTLGEGGGGICTYALSRDVLLLLPRPHLLIEFDEIRYGSLNSPSLEVKSVGIDGNVSVV